MAIVALSLIGVTGLFVLVLVGTAAFVVLLLLRPDLSKREIVWAAALGWPFH